MSSKFEIKGLREVAQNIATLETAIKTDIARTSLRSGALKILDRIKAATYTTFNRLDGMILSGFQVRVGAAAKGDVLSSVIVQREQQLKGVQFKAVRARLRRPGKKRGPSRAVAFWWRFLEFGTKPRGNVRGERIKVSKKGQRSKWKSLQSTGSNRGAVSPRKWVRPSLQVAASGAIVEVSNTMSRRISEEASKLPKTI